MYESNMNYLNNKIERLEVIRTNVLDVIPQTPIRKVTLNMSESKRVTCLKFFKLAIEVANVQATAPVDNYDILFETIKIVERSTVEQIALKNLCVYADAIKLNSRVQAEFDAAVRESNRDKCLLIITEERRRAAEAEAMETELKIRTEKLSVFNKQVTEAVKIISKFLDEDGKPVNKNINVGSMNNYLKKLYAHDVILEAYKRWLDTEQYYLLLKMIEKNLNKQA